MHCRGPKDYRASKIDFEPCVLHTEISSCFLKLLMGLCSLLTPDVTCCQSQCQNLTKTTELKLNGPFFMHITIFCMKNDLKPYF